MEHLAQSMAKKLQSMEETRKEVAALSKSKTRLSKNEGGDGSGSNFEGPVLQGKPPEGRENQPIAGKWSEGIGEASYGGPTANMTPSKEEEGWRQMRKLEMPIFFGENPNGWLF